MSLFDFINKPKDIIISTVLKPLINSEIASYGKVLDIYIDSSAKTITLSIELKGEDKPTEIKVMSYEILKQGENSSIRIGKIKTSREWITKLLADFMPESYKTVPIPPSMAAVAKAIL